MTLQNYVNLQNRLAFSIYFLYFVQADGPSDDEDAAF